MALTILVILLLPLFFSSFSFSYILIFPYSWHAKRFLWGATWSPSIGCPGPQARPAHLLDTLPHPFCCSSPGRHWHFWHPVCWFILNPINWSSQISFFTSFFQDSSSPLSLLQLVSEPDCKISHVHLAKVISAHPSRLWRLELWFHFGGEPPVLQASYDLQMPLAGNL